MDILQANELNLKGKPGVWSGPKKTFKCSLTEVVECLLHFVDIDVCLHLNEFLHKGIAEGILTGGERERERDDVRHQDSAAETCWRPLQSLKQAGYSNHIQITQFGFSTCSIGKVTLSSWEDCMM